MNKLLILIVVLLSGITSLAYSASKEEAAAFIEGALTGCWGVNKVHRSGTTIQLTTELDK